MELMCLLKAKKQCKMNLRVTPYVVIIVGFVVVLVKYVIYIYINHFKDVQLFWDLRPSLCSFKPFPVVIISILRLCEYVVCKKELLYIKWHFLYFSARSNSYVVPPSTLFVNESFMTSSMFLCRSINTSNCQSKAMNGRRDFHFAL